MMTEEQWMNLRAFKPLADLGYSWAEIGRLAGCDWRTAKKYLTQEFPVLPTYGPRRPTKPKLIDGFKELIDGWIRADHKIQAATIFERLKEPPYNFLGSYQRVKEYVRLRRPQLVDDPHKTLMHRRFELLPGVQAQVDWGEEEPILTPLGILPVYSFHMVLSYSRDPFCRYVSSQDLATFWECHRLAFEHFGGVPYSILYDRTKTVVRRHVGRGEETPLHPEAIAFSCHYGFSIELCYPNRPQTKGKVERVVGLTRRKVTDGRTFGSIEEIQAAWYAWLPVRRRQIHRTHGEVIGVRAERDRAALQPLPARPYLVTDRHTRVVGKDCLISFEASLYSVPWRRVIPGQRVELRATRSEITIYTTGADPEHLATHPRALAKGCWVVDEHHWEGLPDRPAPLHPRQAAHPVRVMHIPVARRPLASFDRLVLIQGESR